MVGSESPVSFATTKLSYPIFDAEFDPYNRGFLVVAGGGGENRTGVPNKITLLDVSSRASISQVTDINLSTDEDSPQSIASLTTKKGLITFAGVSSSIADQKSGKNDHFRSYDIEFPPRKRVKRDENTAVDENAEKEEGRINLAGKSSLFKSPTPAKSKVYQRLLRLSPVTTRDTATKRIGAIAAADAPKNEIVIFDATTFIPNASSVLARIDTSTETEDLDLFQHSEGTFGLVYGTDYDVFVHTVVCDFPAKTSRLLSESPTHVFSVPKQPSPRPRLRSLRWLTSKHLILLQNPPPGGRAELIIVSVEDGKVSITQRHRLPKSIGVAVRLDTCCLDADPVTGERQLVVAVAGQDRSIHVFTCNHQPAQAAKGREFTKLTSFSVLDTSRQHPQSISKITFSNFFAPKQPENSNISIASEPQYIYLASVSLGYTVSVEAFALTSVPSSPSSTPDASGKRKSPSVRWVLSTSQGEILRSWYGLTFVAIIVLVAGILLQYYMEQTMRGRGSFSGVTPQAADVVAEKGSRPVVESITSSIESILAAAPNVASGSSHQGHHRIPDLHRHHLQRNSPKEESSEPKKAIHVTLGSENPFSQDVSISLHEDVEELKANGARKFHELEDHEKEDVKKKLVAAGQWSVDEGESILQSIFFSQWADIVGGAIRDAVL